MMIILLLIAIIIEYSIMRGSIRNHFLIEHSEVYSQHEPFERYKHYSKIFSFINTVLTWLFLSDYARAYVDIFNLHGLDHIALVVVIILSGTSHFLWRKFAYMTWRSLYLESIRRYYHPETSFERFRWDAKRYNLVLYKNFEKGLEETLWLFRELQDDIMDGPDGHGRSMAILGQEQEQ